MYLYYLPVPGWWNGVIMYKGKLWLDGYYREFVPFLYFQSLMQYNCPSCLNGVLIVSLHLYAYCVNIDSHADLWTLRLWTLNCVITYFHIADEYWCNKAVWTILKVAFLVFVPVVATNEFAKNRILPIVYFKRLQSNPDGCIRICQTEDATHRQVQALRPESADCTDSHAGPSIMVRLVSLLW